MTDHLRREAEALIDSLESYDSSVASRIYEADISHVVAFAKAQRMVGYNEAMKEHHAELRDMAVEQGWRDRLGEDYGSY